MNAFHKALLILVILSITCCFLSGCSVSESSESTTKTNEANASFNEEALALMNKGDFQGAGGLYTDPNSPEAKQLSSVVGAITKINEAFLPTNTSFIKSNPDSEYRTLEESMECLQKARDLLLEAQDIPRALEMGGALDSFLSLEDVSVSDFDLIKLAVGRKLTDVWSFGGALSEADMRRYVVFAECPENWLKLSVDWHNVAPVFDLIYSDAPEDKFFVTFYPKESPVKDVLLKEEGYAYIDFSGFYFDGNGNPKLPDLYDGPVPLETIDITSDKGMASGGTPYQKIDLEVFYDTYGDNILAVADFALQQNVSAKHYLLPNAIYLDSTSQSQSSSSSSESEYPIIGMTRAEALNTKWGTPSTKNITETTYGSREQWVFDGKGYVYIEHDKVVGVQRTE